jgi:hypothetical protein
MNNARCIRAIFLLAALSVPAAVCAQAQNPPPGPSGYTGHWHKPPAAANAPSAPSATPSAGAPRAALRPSLSPPVQPKKTRAGEEFFIVASIDQTKSQILLKQPSEVTLLMKVTDKTQFVGENGQPLKFSDLRAGDTVWVTSSGGANPTASHIRKGQMTVADLHRYYLDYAEIR